MTTTHKERSLPLPPGSFGLPFIGETISFFRDLQFALEATQAIWADFQDAPVWASHSDATRI